MLQQKQASEAPHASVDVEKLHQARARLAQFIQANAERLAAAGKPTRAKKPKGGWYAGPGEPAPDR